MARISRRFIPNVYIDFEHGAVKVNCLSETFIPFDMKGYTDPMYDGRGNNAVLTKYFCPRIANEMDTSKGLSVKVDTVSVFAAFDHYKKLGVTTPSKEMHFKHPTIDGIGNEYRAQLLCMPLSAPISHHSVAKLPNILDGTKSTVLVKADRGYGAKLQEHLNGSNGIGNGVDATNYLCSTTLVLCSDPRIFSPYAYEYSTGHYKPEGYRDDIKDYREDEDTLPTARKGYFVINGEYTKFLVIPQGCMVKMTAYYEDVKTANGTERVLLWNVDNSSSFTKVDGYIINRFHWAYDSATNQLNSRSEPMETYFGIEEEMNGVYIHKTLAKVYNNAYDDYFSGRKKSFQVIIQSYSALKEYWWDSIRFVDAVIWHVR